MPNRYPQEGGFSNPPHTDTKESGQECLLSVGTSSFFNPNGEINETTHRLPHWQQEETFVFVTWRLGDSLPKAKLKQWKETRDIWLSHYSKPWEKNRN